MQEIDKARKEWISCVLCKCCILSAHVLTPAAPESYCSGIFTDLSFQVPSIPVDQRPVGGGTI